MSLREIVSKPEIWIPSALTAIGALLAWATYGKRKTKVETDKTELEKDDLQFTLRTKMEQHYDIEIEKLKGRILELEKRDEEKDALIEKLIKQIEEQNGTIEELKSNRNFNNTINR